MAAVSYFQPYSGRENTVTATVLQLLRYLYRSNQQKFELLLNNVFDTQAIQVGALFHLQNKLGDSIPDAMLSQNAWTLYIETKTDAAFEPLQIERHIASIAADAHKRNIKTNLLLALTVKSIDESVLRDLNEKSMASGVLFTHLTFDDLLVELKNLVKEYESDLFSVVQDFESYLQISKLIGEDHIYMPFYPCGDSFEQNKIYAMYYEPASRNLKQHIFFGIYYKKEIRFISKVQAIVVRLPKSDSSQVAEFDFQKFNGTEEMKMEIKRKIEEMILASPYHDLESTAHRFYIGDDAHETVVTKTSPGGIMRYRYLNLKQELGAAYHPAISANELAKLLVGKSFE